MISRGDFFFQAEDGIRDLVRSRGLGDVYKRQRQQNFLFDLAPLLVGQFHLEEMRLIFLVGFQLGGAVFHLTDAVFMLSLIHI